MTDQLAQPTRIEAIHRAATSLFRKKGFEATTMRELAAEVGIEAPSLYNHFPSKHVLLGEILVETMVRLVACVRTAISAAGDDPVERLRAAVVAYIAFHADALDAASISDTERRSLAAQHAERVLALRDELGGLFERIVRDGCDRGAFATDDVKLSTIFVLSICARLPVWYREAGRCSLEEVGAKVTAFALDGLTGRA